MRRRIMEFSFIIGSLLLLTALTTSAAGAQSIDTFLDAPLEELLSMEVTSVAKKKQPLNEVAAAIFIITNEDIRRAGVTSIPEALRLAPGLQVARIDANKWAITSRGFNSQFANKLLVMIDGRTLYTPSYSGVYWDAQDTLLEDIERIEVIRGPGASVWGANAVNGVINIITRSATQTQGRYLTGAMGDETRALAGFRHGFAMGAQAQGRYYIKYHDRDASQRLQGGEAGDQWSSLHAGFRVDGQQSAADLWTFQGDYYRSGQHQLLNQWQDPQEPSNGDYAPFYLIRGAEDKIQTQGWNLLGRWEGALSDKASWQWQLYFDHTERTEAIIGQVHDTLDIDFQHQFQPWEGHDLIWGLGYRYIRDHFDNTFLGAMRPARSGRRLYSAFIQDEIELISSRLRLILGSKFEHNDSTGLEIQPSARLLWMPDPRHTVWTAISRAVRTPARLENGSRMVTVVVPAFPPFLPEPRVLHSVGNPHFKAEKLLAFELGYRTQPRENLSLDISLFYNDYQDLQSFEAIDPSTPLTDVRYANEVAAHSHGLELVLDWWPMEWWRLQANYSFIRLSAEVPASSRDPDPSHPLLENASPDHQVSLRSLMDLRDDLQLDLWIYRVGALGRTAYSLADSAVPGYTRFDARLAWRPHRGLELSLVGQNLFDDQHPEFIGENFQTATEVERAWHLQVRWSF